MPSPIVIFSELIALDSTLSYSHCQLVASHQPLANCSPGTTSAASWHKRITCVSGRNVGATVGVERHAGALRSQGAPGRRARHPTDCPGRAPRTGAATPACWPRRRARRDASCVSAPGKAPPPRELGEADGVNLMTSIRRAPCGRRAPSQGGPQKRVEVLRGVRRTSRMPTTRTGSRGVPCSAAGNHAA